MIGPTEAKMRRVEYFLFLLGCIFLAITEAQDSPSLILPGYSGSVIEFATGLNNQRNIECAVAPNTISEDANLQWKDDTGAVLSAVNVNQPYSLGVASRTGTSLSLVFNGIQETMAGHYTCVGTINGVEESITFELIVIINVELEDRHANPNQKLTRGQTGLIACKPDGPSDMEITWYYNGTALDIYGNDRLDQKAGEGLEVKNVEESDAGIYRCFAKGTHNFGYQDISVEVIWPPVITEAPLSQDAVAGSSLTLACKADSKPKATYEWFKEPQTNKLTGDRYVINEQEGILEIKSVIKEDKGQYRCKADNGVSPAATAVADVNVMVKPEVKVGDTLTGDEGGQANLACMASGDPLPQITWTKVGGDQYSEGTQDTDVRVSVTTGTGGDQGEQHATSNLIIQPLESTDRGTYRCLATNAAGEDSKTVDLVVRYKPNFVDQATSSVYTWAGQIGTLTCVANGVPVPTVKWYKNTTEVDTNTYTVQSTETATDQITAKLLTVEVNFGNIDRLVGMYRCEASNDMGTSSQEIILKRAERPGVPVVSILRNTPTTVTMEVSTDVGLADGGPKVSEVDVEYYQDSNQGNKDVVSVAVNQNGAATVVMKGLTPSTPYTFMVRSVSPAGRSDPFQQPHTTLPEREPYPITITTRPIDGRFANTYNLRWDLPDDGGSRITAINIKHRKVKVRAELSQDNLYQYEDKITGYTELDPLDGNARSKQLINLEPQTYYEVVVTATNAHGTSTPEPFIFKTGEAHISAGSQQEGDGLSIGAIIGIVIVVFVILFIIVDVTCYFRMKCGVLKCIKDKLGGGASGDTRTKDAKLEDGDEETTKMLPKDNEQTVVAQDEVSDKTPGELEPEDKEEIVETEKKPEPEEEKQGIQETESKPPEADAKTPEAEPAAPPPTIEEKPPTPVEETTAPETKEDGAKPTEENA